MSAIRVRLQIVLLFVFVATCVVLAWHRGFGPDHPAQAGLETVGWEEAESRVVSGEWILVDARSEKKFLHSHLPGAYSLPADAPADYLRFAAAEWPRQAVVVTYCGSPSCSLAVELATRLREEAGREGVRVLTGNYFEDLYQTGRDAGTGSAHDREEESAH